MSDKVPFRNRFVTMRMLFHHQRFRLALIAFFQCCISVLAGFMIDFPGGIIVAVSSSIMTLRLCGQVRFYIPEDAAVYWNDYYKRKAGD